MCFLCVHANNLERTFILSFQYQWLANLFAVFEKLIRTNEDFAWPIDSTFHGRFTIDVEFLDLKISASDVRTSFSIDRYYIN